MIDYYLSKAKPPPIEGEIFGLILPHAGYIFSGLVAAHGFKAIAGKNFETIIIIGDSHTQYFDGVSIWPAGSWQTPLGKVEIDKELAAKILASSERFLVRDSAHLFEHSLEVQLPFLQKTLKKFKILPIIFGSEEKDWKILAQAILENTKGKKVLIIASSDLSHYPPYEKAKEADLETLEAILKIDPLILEEKIQELKKRVISGAQTFMCAKDSVKTLLEIAKNLKAEAKLLKYANSGDVLAGDRSRVVGYGAIVFYNKAKKKEALSPEEKEKLLYIAKASVENFLEKGKIPEFEVKSERLKQNQGAFVTLKKQGKLRGCIGQVIGNQPLYQIVSQMAVAAAIKDSRFPPVTKEELDQLEYEISVLGPLRKVDSWKEIQIGLHGVQAVAGFRSGLFLPQVATENNWDLETFLDQLMLKAGLWPDYWKENPVDFYVFEAEVFGKSD
jgi:AmmeMemoRadiSam system protein B/AmmeMemoRadiSam system protein A